MMDYLDLAPVPLDEACAQVGESNYTTQSRKECRAFMSQLHRQFGPAPDGAYLMITSNPHDFGNYHEVIVKYNEDSEAASEWAYRIESNLPEKWDEQALLELSK